MFSRFLVVIVAAVLLMGSAGAQAQKTNEAVRKPEQANPSAAPGEAEPVADTSVSSDPNATKDAFDSAAAKLSATDSKFFGPNAKSQVSDKPKTKLEKATFGAGCFWHVEEMFEWLPGVKSAVSGYSGGTVTNPSYEEVHEGVTGHAEVVQVEYDPEVISYEQLLKVFWSGHDPTQINRQGPDVGTQYRSVIFYHNNEQREAALKSYRQLTSERVFPGPVVTQLMPMRAFYRAEAYHQNYYGGKDGPRSGRNSRTKRVRKPTPKVPATSRTDGKLATATGNSVEPARKTPDSNAESRSRLTPPSDPEP